MRLGSRLVSLALLGVMVAWALRPRTCLPRVATSVGTQVPHDELLINQPDTPRGSRAVLFVGAFSAGILVLGLIWYAVDQEAQQTAIALALTHGDAANAPALVTRYGCGGCHTIPGAAGADGKVGPDLSGLRERVYVGGVLRNTPDNLIQWIVDPQRFSPHSAMPATGVSEPEARDIAAYLYAR